jgi:endo-1,4-beta-xylanase
MALTAVLDPDDFLSSHEYIKPESVPYEHLVDGVYVYDMARGDEWSGANIILGNDPDIWPWSEAGEDGLVAFVPEKDGEYRLIINYTAAGTTGIRVRWVKDETNLGYTNADGIVVNDYVYTSDQTAVTIPALFNGDMVNMGSYTLTTEFKMDGSEPADGLVGNIAVRGYQGGNAFSINWMKMESASGELMFMWDPNAKPETDAPAEPDKPEAAEIIETVEISETPETETPDIPDTVSAADMPEPELEPVSGAAVPGGVIAVGAAVAAAGLLLFFFIRRKR